MNRIRIGLSITIILGAIYGAAGLFTSLHDFGIGMAVAAAAVIGYGLTDFIDSTRAERMHQYRAEVWARRDYEASRDTQLRPGLYTRRNDDEAA